MRTASLWAIGLVVAAFFIWAGCARAQSAATPVLDLSSKEISVAVKVAPPFAFKLDDGTWSGLSIEFWRKIADRLKIHFHFVEVPSVQDQIEGVASGKFDVATAAITVTADREETVDFTQPFFSTGSVSPRHSMVNRRGGLFCVP